MLPFDLGIFYHFFVISSILATINTRTIGSVLTLHRHFHLSPLDPLARKRGSAKGPLALWHKVHADCPFRPSGSWRGQRSGVGPCFRAAGPGFEGEDIGARSAFTRTDRLSQRRRTSERGLEVLAARWVGYPWPENRGRNWSRKVRATRSSSSQTAALRPGGTGSKLSLSTTSAQALGGTRPSRLISHVLSSHCRRPEIGFVLLPDWHGSSTGHSNS